MSYEIIGKITNVYDTQEFPSGFTKRTFVVETKDGDYTNSLAIDLLKDKTSLGDKMTVGQEVKVHFNIRSSENSNKEGQWFTNVNAWKIEMQGEPAGTQAPPQNEEPDDIPF